MAAGLCIATGSPAEGVFARLAELQTVNGRLDIVGEARGGMVVVDYAHKPDALEAALDALRPFVSGKLVCVFGCGGDRDRGKRPLMGAIAARLADVVIVTDDNPRTEDAAAIRAELLAAAPGATEIGDRAEAIAAAVAAARPGDRVLLLGKGHEGSIIYADHSLPWDEAAEARRALAALGYV